MSDRVRIGREAEDRAALYLRDLGYTLITRRYRVPGGEIDLIALDDDILVFVEVKVRNTPGYVPEESIGPAKLGALHRTAMAYMESVEEKNRPWRFDLVAINGNEMRHYKNAFVDAD